MPRSLRPRALAPRTLAALATLVLTGGVYVITVGVAARAEAPRVASPYVAAAANAEAASPYAAAANRPPGDVALPLLPPAALSPSLPVRMAIPAIGVDSTVGEVGLAADGTIEVPPVGPTYDQPAWYRYSPTPGELGPAVIEGHLDTPTGAPSVFYRLGQLPTGAQVLIDRADGTRLTYVVTGRDRFAKDAFPTGDVYGNLDHPGLRLITCGGPLDDAGSYRDNVIVFAALAAVEPGAAGQPMPRGIVDARAGWWRAHPGSVGS